MAKNGARHREEIMEIRAIVDCKTSLGEGPLWDVQEQKIYWIDSLGNKVFRAEADGAALEVWDVPAKIGSTVTRKNGGAILSLQNGFHAFDFKTGNCKLLVDPEPDKPGNRLNDGKVDRHGRFICGSMDMKETNKTATLYRLDPDLSVHKPEDNIIVSNGPYWSPDGGRSPPTTRAAVRTACQTGRLGGSLFAIYGLGIKGVPEPRFAG